MRFFKIVYDYNGCEDCIFLHFDQNELKAGDNSLCKRDVNFSCLNAMGFSNKIIPSKRRDNHAK